MAPNSTPHPLFRRSGKPLLSRLALALIRAYQRYLSPRKGFHCAHRRLHGGMSCSGFAASAIERHGLAQGLVQTRLRFRECHAAAQILRAAGPPGTPLPPGAPGKKKEKSTCWDWADCGGCAHTPSCGSSRSTPDHDSSCDCGDGCCGGGGD